MITTTSCPRDYAAAGLSILPIKTDGTKRPRVKEWGHLQKDIPTPAEIDKLFRGCVGVAIIGGRVSGGLECLDIDAPELVEPFEATIRELAPGLLERLPTVATPRNSYGGRHYRYRIVGEVAGNTTLAQSEPRPQFNKDGTPKIDQRTSKQRVAPDTLIETRGEGGYAIAPGSPGECHESGLPYKHVAGPPLTEVPTITADEHSLLWSVARSFNRHTEDRDVKGAPSKAPRDGLLPGDDFSARASWEEILEPAGWNKVFTRGDVTHWRRPGKDDGTSATTGIKSTGGTELFCVFSSNAHPFSGPNGRPCSAYSKFAAYATLDHNGDFIAAAKALVTKGYGDQPANNDEAEVPAARAGVTNSLVKKRRIVLPLPMAQILADVRELTGDWPRRVAAAAFVDSGGRIQWLDSTAAVFGWLASQTGIIRWTSKGIGYVTKSEFYEEVCRTAREYVGAETFPHVPPIEGHYYAGKPIEPGDGKALNNLLERFSPETDIDHDLLRGLIVTPAWGGRGGCRPCFTLTSDMGRGSGKTKAAAMTGHLYGGTIELSANEDAGVIRQRLLSPEGRGKRVALLDNVKTLKFSWAELESMITTPVIGGKQMYVGEGSRPNTLTWIVTLNGASMSTDMAQRSVIIKLKRPKYAATWEEDTIAFIDANRAKLLADVVAFLQSDTTPLARYSRWGSWERDILSRLPEPAEAQRIILERQGIADVEAEESEILEDFIGQQLASLNYAIEVDRIFIPSAVAARWFNWATNLNLSVTAVSRVVKQMSEERKLQRLQENKCKTYGRGFIWASRESDPAASIRTDLQDRLHRRKEGTF